MAALGAGVSAVASFAGTTLGARAVQASRGAEAAFGAWRTALRTAADTAPVSSMKAGMSASE